MEVMCLKKHLSSPHSSRQVHASMSTSTSSADPVGAGRLEASSRKAGQGKNTLSAQIELACCETLVKITHLQNQMADFGW